MHIYSSLLLQLCLAVKLSCYNIGKQQHGISIAIKRSAFSEAVNMIQNEFSQLVRSYGSPILNIGHEGWTLKCHLGTGTDSETITLVVTGYDDTLIADETSAISSNITLQSPGTIVLTFTIGTYKMSSSYFFEIGKVLPSVFPGVLRLTITELKFDSLLNLNMTDGLISFASKNYGYLPKNVRVTFRNDNAQARGNSTHCWEQKHYNKVLSSGIKNALIYSELARKSMNNIKSLIGKFIKEVGSAGETDKTPISWCSTSDCFLNTTRVNYPVIHGDCLRIDFDGRIISQSHKNPEVGYLDTNCSSKDAEPVTVYVSDSIFKSLSFSKKEISGKSGPKWRTFLRYTCSSSEICLGTFLPNLPSQYRGDGSIIYQPILRKATFIKNQKRNVELFLDINLTVKLNGNNFLISQFGLISGFKGRVDANDRLIRGHPTDIKMYIISLNTINYSITKEYFLNWILGNAVAKNYILSVLGEAGENGIEPPISKNLQLLSGKFGKNVLQLGCKVNWPVHI